MADKAPKATYQTVEITNFGGRLTRLLNGDMNSGFAKFATSWGYDPFSKPMNLTWLEAPVNITGPIDEMLLAAKPRFEAGQQFLYAVGSLGKLYKIEPSDFGPNPNLDSVIGIFSVTSSGADYSFGASMEFYGLNERIYVGNARQINTINFDGSGETVIGGIGGSVNGYVFPAYRALKQFAGQLCFANGQTIGVVNSTNAVTSSVFTINSVQGAVYSQLNPPLPVGSFIQDLDVTPGYDYLLITASQIPTEQITTVGTDRQQASTSDGAVYQWNGIDPGITAATTIPSYAVTALQSYLQNNLFFSIDSFGASLNDGTNKMISLPGNKSPLPNSTGVNGNFVFWVAPEIVGGTMVASMYYYGSLDNENPPGLFRVMRYATTISNGFVYQTPLNILTNSHYTSINNTATTLETMGYGKHYFSTYELSNTVSQQNLYRFLITPTGTGTPQLGVYETQTQLFSKKVTIKQVRIYTEPTAANEGFQLDFIGSDGNVITNGTFNYTYSAGIDVTKLQGALERIDFNPSMKDTYALAVRITNTGTANSTIHKIEIDYAQSGQ